MNETNLLANLQSVEKIANFSKILRLLNNPYKYLYALLYRNFIYSKSKKEKIVNVPLFYGKQMSIALPASTDIYLTGGKSHSSEIRLAKFIILNLKNSQHFLDIGAHFGYFTLLAAEVIGAGGKVVCFEPTSKSFNLLQKNISSFNNIEAYQKAISDSTEPITFYEFPNLHSEYNTAYIAQFEKEAWYNNSKPEKVVVQTTTIDNIIQNENFNPSIIKIDVEGAEYTVISSGLTFFKTNSPIVVMEYLAPKRKNEMHNKATALLYSLGYYSHIIKKDGTIEPISTIDNYLEKENLESENIVFRKMKKV